jgi:hypothetical protein
METTSTDASAVEQFMTACLDREIFWEMLSGLDPRTRVTVHDQMWNLVMATARSRNQPLLREDITSGMQPNQEYQRRMGCTEPDYVCRRKTCINSNPSCVSQKISEHIEVIRQHLAVQQSS